MRLISSAWALALVALPLVSAKSAWAFNDGTVSVQGKGTGEGGRFVKEKLTPASPLGAPVALTATDTLKLLLTAIDGKTAARPHQAFLTLADPVSGLEDSWALQVKDTGKAKLDIPFKELPIQLQAASSPLRATLTIASFGASEPYSAHAFDVAVERDATAPPPADPPQRYGRQPRIAHIFKGDPRSPPAVLPGVFAAAVAAALPLLVGVWLGVGANLSALPEAFGAAPLAHAAFVGSLLALEGVLAAYYVSWTLFQTLPALALFGVIAFLSGTRALTEVQDRRLAGKR